MEFSREPEIMSPVGSFESLAAAIQAGAGSVYFGCGRLNMRSRSSVNFTLEDLESITRLCREKGVKAYLTLNTVIFDEEMDEVRQTVKKAAAAGISAIIASDMAVIQTCRDSGMEVHLSTQTNITNIEAVKYYARYADVIVTARELSLNQVATICRQIENENITGPSGKPVRIEIFIHGALCMAVSGKCYLSLDNSGYSANRGACLQPCRRGYLVRDKESELELEVDHEYIMSPKDLKTIHFLDKILASGVKVLKIEGRGRSPEYVKTVTRCYREAVEAIGQGTYTPEKIQNWEKELAGVFNRGFWDGYYLGRKLGEWSETYGSHATKRKIHTGRVTNFFTRQSVAEILIEAGSLGTGDEILITGPTTGVYKAVLSEIRLNDGSVADRADKGETCSILCNETVRRGDKVFRVVAANLADENVLQ
ncbi:MAG TPA: peptidase U32 family protein [Bacteroidales bacterium]|nr:peptidase U32 family protein [Bacteroidales bacterium]HSA44854.1 peptidase U32 family protein [Bacteroidales bacterium]